MGEAGFCGREIPQEINNFGLTLKTGMVGEDISGIPDTMRQS
jgi:hypothetical protein